MTKQETFDTVIAHLRKQGKQSREGSRCKYRGPNGLKCAVGCLIPDEQYSEWMEDFSLLDRRDGHKTEVGFVVEKLGHDVDLCQRLQWIHDEFGVEAWEERFANLAEGLGLTYNAA